MPARPPSSPPPARGDLLARLGWARCPGERTFWMIGHREADWEAAADLVQALMVRHPRVDFLFTAREPATRAWLRERLPGVLVLPPPLPFAFACNRYIVNLNVRGMAIFGAVSAGDRAALRAANKRALPAAVVETPVGAAASAAALGALPERIEHHFVASPESFARLLEAGISAERISRLPATGPERSMHFVDVVSQLLVRDLKLIRSKLRPIRRRLEQLALRSMDNPRRRAWLSAKARRYDNIDDLREALGKPDTILCLGNGPTSENADVARVRYDCLFRVNHVWLSRGFLTEPDVVFTGSKATLAVVRGPIFGLQSIKSEARLLVTRLLRPQTGRVRYFTVERFGLYLSEPRWHGIRPTNGATMLATAVALQPAHLVVSGMDLFSHPAGSYPGDTTTPNAYTPGHNADSELALLLEALRLYKGKLTILSPALRERWDAFRRGQARCQDAG